MLAIRYQYGDQAFILSGSQTAHDLAAWLTAAKVPTTAKIKETQGEIRGGKFYPRAGQHRGLTCIINKQIN